MLEIVRSISASLLLAAAVMLLAGCSDPTPETKPAKVASPYGPGPATTESKNPVAKFIELAGFRLSEKGGKLQIKFTAINHSEADLEELQLHLHLFTALMGLAYLMDAPPIIRAEIPDLVNAKNRFDPRFQQNENARVQMHMITMFLNQWQRHDFGALLDRVVTRIASNA